MKKLCAVILLLLAGLPLSYCFACMAENYGAVIAPGEFISAAKVEISDEELFAESVGFTPVENGAFMAVNEDPTVESFASLTVSGVSKRVSQLEGIGFCVYYAPESYSIPCKIYYAAEGEAFTEDKVINQTMVNGENRWDLPHSVQSADRLGFEFSVSYQLGLNFDSFILNGHARFSFLTFLGIYILYVFIVITSAYLTGKNGRALYANGGSSKFYGYVCKARGFADRKISQMLSFWNGTGPRAKNVYALVFFCVLSAFMYRNFLFGNSVFILEEQDPHTQIYPRILDLSKMIWSGEGISLWSFNYGLGVNYLTISNDPGNILVALMGPESVAYCMGVMQAIKIALCCFVFYLYIRQLRFSFRTAVFVGVAYGFCANTISRGVYIGYTILALCFALLLWLFEKYLSGKRAVWIVFPFVLLWISGRLYYGILFTGLLIAYAVWRGVMQSLPVKKVLRTVLTTAGLSVLAFMICALFMLPSVLQTAESSRFESTFGRMSFWSDFLRLPNWELFKSFFYQLLSSEIQGSYYNYLGAGTYFIDGPKFYMGLLTLLAIPQGWSILRRDRRLLGCFIAGVVAAALYIFLPGVSWLSAGMVKDTFKTSSLWVTVLLLYFSAFGMERILSGKANPRLLVYSAVCTAFPLLFSFAFGDESIMARISGTVLILISIYAVIMFLFSRKLRRRAAVLCLLVLFSFESFILNTPEVDWRGMLTTQRLNADGYRDGSDGVIKKIQNGESEPFFRIDKNFQSVYYNDSLGQDFFGVQLYSGGAGVSGRVSDFYDTFGIPLGYNRAGNLLGFTGIPEIEALSGIKYMVSAILNITDYGFSSTDSYGGHFNNGFPIYAFHNPYALPLGVVYGAAVSETDFLKLSVPERRDEVLRSAVLADDSPVLMRLGRQGENSQTSVFATDISVLPVHNIEFDESNVKNFGSVLLPECDSGDTIILSVTIDCRPRTSDPETAVLDPSLLAAGTTGALYWWGLDSAVTPYPQSDYYLPISIKEGEYTYYFEMSNQRYRELRFSFRDPQLVTFKSITFQTADSDKYYAGFVSDTETLQENSMRITGFRQDRVTGTVNIANPGFLHFSIPYDTGWQCLIDGKPAALETANVMFMGVYLAEAGEHTVELRYYPTNYTLSLCLTSVGLAAFLFIIVSGRRRGNQTAESN